MSCDCENIVRVCIGVNPCNEGTAIGITAAQTGTYGASLLFNGVTRSFTIEAVENEEMAILTSLLNESYVHELRLTDPIGNVTCHYLSTHLDLGAENSPVTPSNPIQELEIEVDADDISTTTETDDTLTNAWFDGKVIRKIYMGTQVYIRGDGFEQNGDEIILINGASWLAGQLIIAET